MPKKTKPKKKRRVRCHRCKELFDKKGCIYGYDPYMEEIYGECVNLAWRCERCHGEICDEV